MKQFLTISYNQELNGIIILSEKLLESFPVENTEMNSQNSFPNAFKTESEAKVATFA